MDQWTDRLSEYLDDELTSGEKVQMEAHLAECDACRIVLDELRAVTVKAASLPPTPPSANLWPGIEARLERRTNVMPFRERAARRFSFTMPQLVAAAAALMVVSGGSVWLRSTAAARRRYHPWWRPTGRASRRCRSSIVSYDEAIADLQQALDAGRSQLDPETVKILESNLAAIDQAIDQSRRALDADPANVYLHNHLAEARQRKLALLRRANALVGKS